MKIKETFKSNFPCINLYKTPYLSPQLKKPDIQPPIPPVRYPSHQNMPSNITSSHTRSSAQEPAPTACDKGVKVTRFWEQDTPQLVARRKSPEISKHSEMKSVGYFADVS